MPGDELLLENTAYEETKEELLSFFEYSHLPPPLWEVSKLFYDTAWQIEENVDECYQKIRALEKLLEAKDHAVRANLPKKPVS